MEQTKCLGIYWKKNSATAVLASFEGEMLHLWNCFFVEERPPVDEQEKLSLSQLLSQACIERRIAADEVAVAVDCGMFTQHSVHSDFTTVRQIAQTIRFDAEEALAADASKLAIAFNVTGSNESGSDVCVYSADRGAMMNILADIQNNKFDPVAMEPDAVCLVRFIQYAFMPDAGKHPLYVLLGRRFGYFIAAGHTTNSWQVRTFVIGANQDRNALVQSQILMTIASLSAAENIDSLKIFDAENSVNISNVGQETGLAAEPIDLSRVMEPIAAGMAEHPDPLDFAIASGAAMGHLTKTRVDFRNDFMPYQGKRILLEKTLKMLSISVTLMLLAVGLYFQLRVYKANSYIAGLHEDMKNEYTAVFNKKAQSHKDVLSNLNRELIRVQKIKSGQIGLSGEASVSALLTYVIEALNESPPQVQVNIDYITVGTKSIMIAGDTASRENTIALFNAFDSHKHLKTSQPSYDFKSGRDQFKVTLLPKDLTKK